MKQIAVDKYGRKQPKLQKETAVKQFDQGDNVLISAMDTTGIVYQGPDETGNYIVQVKGEKQTLNHKRLTLYVRAAELYPADYDFDIIFKSKEYRKKKHLMGRKYVEGLAIDEDE